MELALPAKIEKQLKRLPSPLKEAMLENLLITIQRIQLQTDAKRPLAELHCQFIHIEPQGILAITEKGGQVDGKKRPKMAATRLYLYAKDDTIHVLCLGTKDSQKSDIQFCKQQIQNL